MRLRNEVVRFITHLHVVKKTQGYYKLFYIGQSYQEGGGTELAGQEDIFGAKKSVLQEGLKEVEGAKIFFEIPHSHPEERAEGRRLFWKERREEMKRSISPRALMARAGS